jgi:ubiquinone/menaquinone biosynthesis C-methylase UbiE
MNNCAVFFGSKSAEYEQNAKIQSKIAEETVKFCDQKVPEIKNGLWLDLGSGTGLARKKLVENFGEINIISLDISSLPLIGNKNRVCGDFDFLPFLYNSFDNIISCSALQWSKNIKNALQNSFDVLNIGGKFILAIFGDKTLEKLRLIQNKFGIKPLVSFYKQEFFEEILLEVGFEIIAKNKIFFSQKFNSAYDALKSISKIGATSHGGKTLYPKEVKEFVEQYQKMFDGGEIVHEYETFFYILEKR